ncbi:STAS domain-containing protein [Aquincola sp. MAHUQ-54]|uniref:STAS domain-containing protein n=1 Tax=Aquincola agrisoli TaxID=3119538 RepID=A0AAW9QCP5_9BURK
MTNDIREIAGLIGSDESGVIQEWLAEGSAAGAKGSTQAVQAEAAEFLRAFSRGLQGEGDAADFDNGAAWAAMRSVIGTISRSRAAQGATAAETAAFLLSFKKPLFNRVQQALGGQPERAIRVLWAASLLVDRIAQESTAVYQQAREDIIKRQQEELLELSTPVVKLWDGVLAVPMIGTLDSSRTQLVMETLLQRLVETESQLAIIDITGVPTVDTLVAQHLLKTVAAIRLMGADCIISGIRPQIAQTIVHLGIELHGITTRATLADALAIAIKRSGYTISRSAEPA